MPRQADHGLGWAQHVSRTRPSAKPTSLHLKLRYASSTLTHMIKYKYRQCTVHSLRLTELHAPRLYANYSKFYIQVAYTSLATLQVASSIDSHLGSTTPHWSVLHHADHSDDTAWTTDINSAEHMLTTHHNTYYHLFSDYLLHRPLSNITTKL